MFAFFINIFTIFITVIIINWNFRSPRSHPMPTWIRVVFINYLPRIILMKRPHHNDRLANKAYTLRHNQARQVSKKGFYTNITTGDDSQKKTGLQKSTVFDISANHDVIVQKDVNVPMTAETHKAMEAIRYIAAHLRNEDDFSEVMMYLMRLYLFYK